MDPVELERYSKSERRSKSREINENRQKEDQCRDVRGQTRRRGF